MKRLTAIAPKIGFEIESIHFDLVGTIEKAHFLLTQLDHTKGQPILFFLPAGVPNVNINSVRSSIWLATTEVQSSLKVLQLEMIYGGPTGIPISTAETEISRVGQEMTSFLGSLDKIKPLTRAASLGGVSFMRPNNLAGLATTHPDVGWVAREVCKVAGLGFHATAPVPLAALPNLVDFQANPDQPLFGTASLRRNMFPIKPAQIVTRSFNVANLKWLDGTPSGAVYGRNSVAGLLILICSYASKARLSPDNVDMNLETLTPLMPRTDFAAMLNIVLQLMEPGSAQIFKENLSDVVATLLRRKKEDLATLFFNWAPISTPAPAIAPSSGGAPPHPPPPPAPATAVAHSSGGVPLPPPPPPPPPPTGPPGRIPIGKPEIQPNNLPVSVWLDSLTAGGPDLIAQNDERFREAQVGALGTKVETRINDPSRLCPILEFRGIGSARFDQLALGAGKGYMELLLESVKRLHVPAAVGLSG